MELYWKIFGIAWIVFNYKNVTFIYEELKTIQKYHIKPVFKFHIILLKWVYLCIAALVPPACFGFLNSDVRNTVFLLWVLISFYALYLLPKIVNKELKKVHTELKEKLQKELLPPKSESPQHVILLAFSKTWVQVMHYSYDDPNVPDKERLKDWITAEEYIEFNCGKIVVEGSSESVFKTQCLAMTENMWNLFNKLPFQETEQEKKTLKRNDYEAFWEAFDTIINEKMNETERNKI